MFVAGRLISRNFKNLYSNLNNLIFSLFFFLFIKISYRWLTIEIIDNFEMNSFEGNVIIYSFEIYIIFVLSSCANKEIDDKETIYRKYDFIK